MKRSKSLIFKIFLYFSIFSLLTLFFVWVFQLVFLNNYYEYYKTNELKNTLEIIKKNYGKSNFNSILENVSYNTDFCVELSSNGETIYSNIQNNKGCLDTKNSKVIKRKVDFINSDKEEFKLKIINPRFNNMTLLYGIKLNSTFNSPNC